MGGASFLFPMDAQTIINFDSCDLVTIAEHLYIPWVAVFDYGTSAAPEVIS
jgi:hypothetical protein